MELDFNALAAELGKKNADNMKAMFDAARAEDQKSAVELQAKLLNDLGPDSPHVKAMQGQLDAISTELKTRNDREVTTKAFRDVLKDNAVGDKIKTMRENRIGFSVDVPLDFRAKLGTVMLNSTNVSSYLPRATWIPGVSKTQDETPFLSQLIPIVPTTSNTIYYVNRTARTQAAAAQTEGNALPIDDFTYAGVAATIEDIGAYTKISDNMLGDNDFVAGQLDAELPQDVLHAQDVAIQTIILAGATAFSAAGKTYLNNVVDANNYDVLVAAVNQARVANFMPDTILVNWDDFTMMMLSKTAQGVPVFPTYYTGNVLTVLGVRVIPNNTMTTGTYCVCTLNKTYLAMRQALTMEFGYDADDFTKRLVTVRAYVRSKYIKSSQVAGGFITSTFADGITALNK